MWGSNSQCELAVMASPGYRPDLRFHGDVEAYFLKVFREEHFRSICRALTCPSSYACVRVNTLQSTSQEVLIKLNDLLTNLNTPFIEKPEMLAWQKDGAKRSAHCFEHPSLKNTIIVQGDGPHQIDYSGNDALLKEVVVSRKCAEAVLRGANVFVPGVLACTAHVEQGDIVAVSVAVEHLDENGDWVVGVTRGTILFSEHGNAQLKDRERKHCYIGKGRAMLSRAGMFRELQGVAVEMVDRVYSLPPLHGILKGEIFLQNLPSIVAARVLDPQPGECILDMCAAPGGKTTAMAILMKDRGIIVATDRSHNKVMDIQRLSEEMKITCVHACKLDALKAVQADQSQSECLRALLNSKPLKSVLSSEVLLVSKANHTFEASEKTSQNCSTSALTPDNLVETGERKQYPSNAKARKEARKSKNGPQQSGDDAKTNQVKGFLPHAFDKVLLDPPCSALGLRPRLFAGELISC